MTPKGHDFGTDRNESLQRAKRRRCMLAVSNRKGNAMIASALVTAIFLAVLVDLVGAV
jgi:hypothetical protein